MQDPSTLEIVIRTLIALPVMVLLSFLFGAVWVWILDRGDAYDEARAARRPDAPVERGRAH